MRASVYQRGDGGLDKSLGHRLVVSALRGLIVVIGLLSPTSDAAKSR